MLHARFTNTLGDFTIELFEEQAPNTVANFAGLAAGTKPFDQLTLADVQSYSQPINYGVSS